MKKLLSILVLIVLFPDFSYAIRVVCDEYPTTEVQPTEFSIFLDSSTTAIISPAETLPNGSVRLSWDITSLPTGNHSARIKAIRRVSGTIVGESTEVTFSWTQPVAISITTQPANVTVMAGTSATFTVVATGIPAPTYQWQRSNDGAVWNNISGATSSSYSLSPVVIGDNGARFRCVLSNLIGTVTSGVATLTVTSSNPNAPSGVRIIQ